MSWLKNLCTTYDMCAGVACISPEDDADSHILLPIGHALKESQVVIHLQADGTFLRAEKSKAFICSPCSVESDLRTSSGAYKYPHPLFDQIKYILGNLYLENLVKWRDHLKSSTEHELAYGIVSAVHRYIARGTLKSDLDSCNVKYKEDSFVRFCVNIPGQLENRLWKMQEMQHAWNSYYESEGIRKPDMEDLSKYVCYVSGQSDTTYIDKHPKSINRVCGNAKLISRNDEKNFTYRGRFEEAWQAATISYEASQKIHQALRWLIARQGYRCGSQAIVTWAVDKAPKVPDFYEDSYGIYKSEAKTDSQKLAKAEGQAFINYAKRLNSALLSSGNPNRLKTHARRVAVIATDAATKGRMAITYYRELGENEYLERVLNWHNTCCWYQPFGTRKDGQPRKGYFIGAPSFDRITSAIHCQRKKGKDETYDKLKKDLRERLLHCVFDGDRLPRDMVNAAVIRASNPLTLENKSASDAAGRWRDWEEVLCAACALTRKHYHEHDKGEFEMSLEGDRTDRDYLYGRLLAVADRIESRAKHKQGNLKGDARATNAMRYMTVFSQRPFRTWNTLFSQQLNPYILQLHGANWYLGLIEDIVLLFKEGEFETDTPLQGAYLLGFFAQRHELRQKKAAEDNGGEDKEGEGGVDNELD